MMSKVRAKNTGPEMVIRFALFKKGFRYRVHVKTLPGCPDIVLPKYNAIIFVNGCFWHGHSCKAGKLPKTNAKFWEEKISGNKKRDMTTKDKLEWLGWKILTVWECCLKNSKTEPTALIEQITRWIEFDQSNREFGQ